MNKTDFLGLTFKKLEERLQEFGLPVSHAKELFRETYRRNNLHPWMKKDFSKKLVESLQENFFVAPLKIQMLSQSRYDQSVKFIFEFQDEMKVETVLMPEKTRFTLCISSQVGCSQGCVFCHTGRMGLKRNLTTAEMVGQVLTAKRWLEENYISMLSAQESVPEEAPKISNVVFMGMGEPLDNFTNVLETIQILTNPLGLGLAPRKVTLSTAGHLPGLKLLQESGEKVALAVSLHSPRDAERSKVMPINREFPLQTVLDEVRDYCIKTKQDVMFQYILIQGVNDSLDHARELLKIAHTLPCKFNLIPLNVFGASRFAPPEPEVVWDFARVLLNGGIRTMVRFSKGQDINAACGQLITRSVS